MLSKGDLGAVGSGGAEYGAVGYGADVNAGAGFPGGHGQAQHAAGPGGMSNGWRVG